MRSKFVAALVLIVVGVLPVSAQEIEITPFIGWETSGSYPVDSSNPQAPPDVQAYRANAAESFGLDVDYPLGNMFAVEFQWVDNPTTYSAQSVSTGLYSEAFTSRIDQYQFGGLLYLRDRRKQMRPFMVGSLGFTHDANGGGNPGRTAFGFGVGGGVSYRLARHFALRGEAEWLPTYGSNGIGQICDTGGLGFDYFGYGGYGGCYNGPVHNFLQRFNFDIGLTIRP